MKVLLIGPSITKSKGGMATVIDEMKNSKDLNSNFDIDAYSSYVDGNKIKVLFYSLFSLIRFYFTKRGYDIYHIHAASYGSTFRKGLYIKIIKHWKKKAVLHIHGGEYLRFYNNSNKKDKIIKILKSADMIIVLSNYWKDQFEKVFSIKDCKVLENSIDLERLKPAIRKNIDNTHSLLMLGRLGERKGTYDLINAIKLVKECIPNILCYLAGDGEIEKCNMLVKQNNLEDNIKIVGWINFDQKIQLLNKTSILVLPSYNEGLPMSILEGMACGKTIISTTVGAIPEVVKEENGILITPGDVNALSNAIIKCCKDTDYINFVYENNVKLVEEKYNLSVYNEKLIEYYNSIL